MKRILKFSRSVFVLAIALVNGAIIYLVPMIEDAGLPPDRVPLVQGFAVVALNAILVYLTTEEPAT